MKLTTDRLVQVLKIRGALPSLHHTFSRRDDYFGTDASLSLTSIRHFSHASLDTYQRRPPSTGRQVLLKAYYVDIIG